MRKSERLRMLEMHVLRLEFQIEYLTETIKSLVEMNPMLPNLDANKWYSENYPKND